MTTPADISEDALMIRVVVPETAHVTVLKALRIMGFGSRHLLRAPTDDRARIDPDREAAGDRQHAETRRRSSKFTSTRLGACSCGQV